MSDRAESAGDGRNTLQYAALSDIGLRRANNQDSFAVALAADDGEVARRGHLFMVADGIGAHAAGELASKIACDFVPHTYRKLLDPAPSDALRHSVLAANANIHERGQANAEFQGMGTTCSVLVMVGGAAIVAHVGDSRVYRLHHDTLEQLTFDHSLVWEMMAIGQMPRGEIAGFIPKNIITRSLGPHADVQVDMEGPYALEPGDTFLLCSDGLSGQLKDEEIGAVLATLSPSDAVRALVDMANLRGGPDNVTAVVVRVLVVPTAEGDRPLALETHHGGSSVHPALWGIWPCACSSLTLAMAGKLAAALASGLVAAATAVAALLNNLIKSSAPARRVSTGRWARASRHPSAPDAERVAVFCQMAQQLREAAKEEHWTLDWAQFNAHGEQAHAALVSGDYRRALREYALAIMFMMNQIRHQALRRNQRDSSVLDM